IGGDLVNLEKLAGELADWIGKAGKEPGAWAGWKGPASAAIEALQEKNQHRFNIWAVWAEYQGRMRIDGLSGYLERTIAALDDRDGNPKRVRDWMAGFLDALDEAYT